MAFARIVTHYFANHAWLENGALLCRANRLQGIPGVLIHGRLDISSPLSTAWELAKVWPDAELLVIDSDGHGGESMTTRLVEVTDRFRTA